MQAIGRVSSAGPGRRPFTSLPIRAPSAASRSIGESTPSARANTCEECSMAWEHSSATDPTSTVPTGHVGTLRSQGFSEPSVSSPPVMFLISALSIGAPRQGVHPSGVFVHDGAEVNVPDEFWGLFAKFQLWSFPRKEVSEWTCHRGCSSCRGSMFASCMGCPSSYGSSKFSRATTTCRHRRQSCCSFHAEHHLQGMYSLVSSRSHP